MLEAADLGGEGGEAMTMTTTREKMTTSTTSDSAHPAHITITFWTRRRVAFRTRRSGGVATVDVNLQGRVSDATNKENIRTTATEKEKERVRATVTRRMAVPGSGARAKMKTTTTEAAVEATAVAGGVDTDSATT